MPAIKEFYLDPRNGQANFEYDDGTTKVVSLDQASGSGGGPVGTFGNTSLLEAAFPAASNGGRNALVGAAAPYVSALSDGVAWRMQANTAYLGPVATRNLVPNAKHATNKQGMFRTVHYARDNISALQLGFANWYYAFTVESTTSSANTFTASVEYPIGTTPQRILFSGSDTGTAPNGTTLFSDMLLLTVQIPEGEPFVVYTWSSNSGGLLYNTTCAYIAGDRGVFGVTTADLTATGSATFGSPSVGTFPPLVAILGMTTKPTVALIGDSIMLGAATLVTAASAGNFGGDNGFTGRSIGQKLAYINMGSYGDKVQTYLTQAPRRQALAAYCSHRVCNYGTNDINAGRTAVQVLADLAAVAALAPKKPMHQATVCPLTTSTDSWTTVGNQTVAATEAERVALNNALRDAPVWAAGLIDLADKMESGYNSGFWKAPGFTADGTHPSIRAQTYAQGAGVVNPTVFSR